MESLTRSESLFKNLAKFGFINSFHFLNEPLWTNMGDNWCIVVKYLSTNNFGNTYSPCLGKKLSQVIKMVQGVPWLT